MVWWKTTIKMSEYFPKPKSLWAKVKAEIDLSSYATKADAGIYTSKGWLS